MILLRALIVLSVAYAINGANVLFFFGLSTYSHRITVWPLAEKLADKGHKVTFVQPFKPKKPNPKIVEFAPKEIKATFSDEMDNFDFLKLRLEGGHAAIIDFTKQLPAKGLEICESFLKSPETQGWMKKSKFDLVVVDALMNECGYGLSHYFGAKTIIYGTTHPFSWWIDVFGMPAETSWIPEMHMPFPFPMNLYAKTVTTLTFIGIYLQKQYSYYPELDKVFREHLHDPNMPSVADLERQTSLIFTNTHFSEELARSLPPLVVPIGGMHCEDSSQKLTKELETFINGSGDDGFIYISFGSAAKISLGPKEFQNIFYKALANSKTRFVWKFEGTRPAEMPANVITDTWMPQQAILASPKIKGFLTHGGLLGIQEAVWHGVPLLAIPMFAEQDYNSMRIERTERGIFLDVNSLTTEKLQDAIHQLVTNPKFKKNMQLTSRLFKDRPMKPLDTALWWTEYVLRNDDLECLKPLGIHQTWYERRLLDVWVLIFVVILTILTAVLLTIKKVIKLLCCSSSSSSSSSSTSSKKSPAKSSRGKAKKN